LCATLEVATADAAAGRGRPVSARARRRATLLVAIHALHAAVKACSGSLRSHAERVARGRDGGVNPGARLMPDHDIRAQTARTCRCPTDSNHDRPVAENLLDRQFNPAAANEGGPTAPPSRPGRAGCT
jgi:hypothetical protein